MVLIRTSLIFLLELFIYLTLHFTIASITDVNGDSPNDEVEEIFCPDSAAGVILLNLNRCGQVLTGITGKIVYELDLNYGVNERCAWIIRVPEATKYSFYLKESELKANSTKGDGDGVILSGLGFGVQTSVMANDRSVSYALNATAVLITFFSNSKSTAKRSGFELHYEVDSESESANLIPRDFILSEESGKLTYPCVNAESNSSSDNFATFLFSPGFSRSDNSEKFVKIHILGGVQTSFEGEKNHCFDDLVDVYYFSELSSGLGEWKHMGRISSCSENWRRLRNSDMIMLIINHNPLTPEKPLQISFSRS